VVSARIEHQHHHVDHTVASESFCAVHPRHQELVGGSHDTEAKQEYVASVQRCTPRQEVGDQLGESAKPRPSLLAGYRSAAEDLPRFDAGLEGTLLVRPRCESLPPAARSCSPRARRSRRGRLTDGPDWPPARVASQLRCN
jgi:hypothetical protein